jgi:hypothetical protein
VFTYKIELKYGVSIGLLATVSSLIRSDISYRYYCIFKLKKIKCKDMNNIEIINGNK